MRNGLLGIGLIALAVLVIVILAWVLLNNGPTGWKVIMYCCEAIDHSTDGGVKREITKMNDSAQALPADKIWGLKYWGFLNKKLTISFKKVQSDESLRQFIDENTSTFMLDHPEEKITVDPAEGSINLSRESKLEPYRQDDEVAMRELLKEKGLCKIDYCQYCDSNDGQKDLKVFRFVVDRSATTDKYAIYFVVLTFSAILAAVCAAWKYAI